MKFVNKYLLIICSYFLIHPLMAQIQNTKVEASIKVNYIGSKLEVTGVAFNKTEIIQSIHYKLSVIKNNPESSNQSKNDQIGRKVLEGFERATLSQTIINSNTTDRIIVLLLIYDENDKLLGSSRYVMNDDKDENEVKESLSQLLEQSKEVINQEIPQNHNSFQLTGVVIDESKTKAGRDFYQLFYSSYLSNKINGDKIVVIHESITMGNNTKISVRIDNQLIFEFFVRSQYDYIKSMVDLAIRRVTMHFENLKRETQLIKRY